MKIWDMEEGEGAFSHDREAKGQNINVGCCAERGGESVSIII
jgi:hypothetical protein